LIFAAEPRLIALIPFRDGEQRAAAVARRSAAARARRSARNDARAAVTPRRASLRVSI